MSTFSQACYTFHNKYLTNISSETARNNENIRFKQHFKLRFKCIQFNLDIEMNVRGSRLLRIMSVIQDQDHEDHNLRTHFLYYSSKNAY